MLQDEKRRRGSFWAMNLNMAIENFQNIVEHASRFGKSDYSSKETENGANFLTFVEKSFAMKELKKTGKDANPSRQRKITRDFIKCLPCLQTVRQYVETKKDKERKTTRASEFLPRDLYDLLSAWAKTLNELRNYFAHFYHDRPTKLRWDYLFVLYEANLRTTKERFYRPSNKEDDANVEKRLTYYRPKIVKNREATPNPNFKFAFFEKSTNLEKGESEPTAAGLAFFIAQFLERRYVESMFDTPDPEDNENLKPIFSLFAPRDDGERRFSLATSRLYSVRCARLPRRRMESDARPEIRDETLGLDLLGYLTRCPETIFEYLSYSDRERFRLVPEKGDDSELLNVRSDKRFPALALTCLDRASFFKRIRFQIDMGRYLSAPHSRRLIDGTSVDDRRVGKKIYWFARIQDAVGYYRAKRVEPESKYYIARPGENPPDSDYLVDSYPKYFVNEDQIGFRLTENDREDPFPKLIPWKHSKARRDKNDKTTTRKAEFFLSRFDLPALLFVGLCGKGEEAERAIVDFGKAWRKFLNDVRTDRFNFGANLPLEEGKALFEERYKPLRFLDLPDEFKSFFRTASKDCRKEEKLKVEKSYEANANAFLDRAVEQTRRRLATLRSESAFDFKIGKSERPTLTPGTVAAWLVKDFMFFQYAVRSEKRFGKISSAPDYIALQSALACFSLQKDELRRIFDEAKLTSKEWREKEFYASNLQPSKSLHPFLSAALARRDALADWRKFYEAYLNARLEWLRCCDPKEPHFMRFFERRSQRRRRATDANKSREVWKEKAERLAREPINLPRSLFTGLLKEIVRDRFPEEFKTATNDGALSTNASWLISKYREWSGDESQDFYRLPRRYESGRFAKLFEICGFPPPRPDEQGAFGRINKAVRENFDARYETAFKKRLEDSRREIRNSADSRDEKRKRLDGLKENCRQAIATAANRFSDQEREIRRLQIQDYVLAKAASYFLFQRDITKIQLKAIGTSDADATGKNPLRELTSFRVFVSTSSSKPFGITGEMNLKNFGGFQRFLSDPRLPSFLRLLRAAEPERDEIRYIDLANEFTAYNRDVRFKMFRLIYKFETTCFERSARLREINSKVVDFKTIASTVFPDDEAVQLRLSVVRNAFAHQGYPYFDASKAGDGWSQAEFDEWNREMWNGYDPLRFPLCRCVLRYAENAFNQALEIISKR